jgi:hypothetical protein
MLMKSLSNKDVALIKRALKYLKKNQELKADTEYRLDFLLKDITEDEQEKIFLAVYETVYKDKTRKDLLDGKKSNFELNDLERRNTIATLLSDWGLIALVKRVPLSCATLRQIKIIPFKEKEQWELCPKYNIGNTRQNTQ